MTQPPFGRLVTAMVTPFAADGSVDLDKAADLATYLVDEQRNDALVINGTTGESPTTSDDEKLRLLQTVIAAVGDRAQIIAGVGTFDTAHTLHLARQAAGVGADGLLVVTPYYSRPPQDALAAHFLAVADATDRPVILYDIPHRTGVPIETETLLKVAEHPRIVAVKDAKGLLVQSAIVMANSDLAFYAGDDAMLLPLMAVGGAGVVGTSTHFSGARTAEVIAAWLAGDISGAISAYRALLGVYQGVFATQGVMLVKAGLAARGRDVGGVRAPLLNASESQTKTFVSLLDAAGL